MSADTRPDTSSLQVVPTGGVYWSAAQAARETGAARSTILAALAEGRIQAERDGSGAWRITPQALGAAGFRPGKPSPPQDTGKAVDNTGPRNTDPEDVHALRLELVEARAAARVAAVERDAERRLRESAERERDTYRRMIEARPEETPVVASTVPVDASAPTPAPEVHAPTGGPSTAPRVGRFRRAWNVLRY